MIGNRFLISFVKAAVALVVLVVANSGTVSAADATCSGGSIASGFYSNLTISGACSVNSGPVTVNGNLTILAGASLDAVTGGIAGVIPPSNLTVSGNVDVQAGGVLDLGCEPFHYTCANDPGFAAGTGTYLTQHTVFGNLTAENALGVVIHHSVVGGNLSINGSSAGTASCGVSVPALEFSPPYDDIEDVTIGGNFKITGVLSCWVGWFRDTVLHNATFSQNATGDPDGNEMGDNIVVGNLDCSGDTPAPQFGDSMAGPTQVLGNATGQCIVGTGLVIH